MKKSTPPRAGGTPSITDHEGILKITPKEGGTRVEIAFDPEKLGEMDLRAIASRHISPAFDGQGPSRRWVLRLDGEACEAAASRLEKRVERVHGVRKATATYIGRVLCLTFDPSTTDASTVLAGVRAAGADAKPMELAVPRGGSTFQRLRAGELNEEIFCGIGLFGLIAAAVIERIAGGGPAPAAFYVISYLFGGFFGVRSAIASLRERTLDVDLLMVLAALGAAGVGAPFEGALLLFLFSLSNVLQSRALDRTRREIEALLKLRPEKATRKIPGGVEQVAVSVLVPGDVVILRPGDLVPVDGVIVEGATQIDESSLTGESMPVDKPVGSEVFAGTLNQSGAVEVRVTRGSEDSALAKMVRLVAEAQAEKSRTQRFLEKAEQGYAGGVILFTIAVLLVPWLFRGEDFGAAFYRAMTVMVVASPCALIISTPATVLSAIGGAAKRGILIKGGAHLETAARVDILCFDKTGTLTVGRPALTEIILPDGIERPGNRELSPAAREILRLCAGVESRSEHPLAAAIVAAARAEGIEVPEARGFHSTPGKGAEATVEQTLFVVGSERHFRELNATGLDRLESGAEALQQRGKTCIWFGRQSVNGVEALAAFALADTLRPGAREIVRELRACGLKRIVMLTGDQQPVAAAIAREAGIDEFRAGLLPSDKVQAIRDLRREGTVAMVGDGVNDAPALAAAHLGVAMGAAGADIAMETADVVLMGERLDGVPDLLGLARAGHRVVVQNFAFALSVIAMLVAAALGLNLPLTLGVIGHEGSTVLVCLNGLRLLAWRRRPRKSR